MSGDCPVSVLCNEKEDFARANWNRRSRMNRGGLGGGGGGGTYSCAKLKATRGM